jgi:cobalt/nickel transport system permease protein
LAGYVAINAAALVTAVEFGLQPAFFKDPSGAPLYCPYPLGVAIPAMMIGHLTLAGIAELVLTGGVVAFLQRTDVSLIAGTAGRRVRETMPGTAGSGSLRPLWVMLGVLMVLTPLGLLAAGTAWGEWQAADFHDPAARQAIADASLGHTPPAAPPSGLARLSAAWTAPLPDYAPPFLRSAAVGYALSAMFGVGMVILAVTGMAALLQLRRRDRTADETVGA